MYKKNELKNLIYIQENEQCNEQTIKGLFRSIVEPLLEQQTESIVLLRLEDKSKNDFNSILKRLNFTTSTVYDFSKKPIDDNFKNILKEDIWEKTEFVYVLSQRYGAVLVFDYEDAEIENYASYYMMYNSNLLSEAFNIINANSKQDLKKYSEEWRPDRRENELLNSSIRKLVSNLNDSNQEMLISQVGNSMVEDNDAKAQLDFISSKSRYASHELKNLISICRLYSEIIEKQTKKIKFEDKEVENSINNALKYITKATSMSSNMLMTLKSVTKPDIKAYSLETIIENAIEMSKVYAIDKKITFKNENKLETEILADEEKLTEIIINLIKNAVESIEKTGEIKIYTKEEGQTIKIVISNNGTPIEKITQKNLFTEGFTTKTKGNGLGLAICQKSIEEQYGKLELLKSDKQSTDFEITILKG
ncbi:MAG: HAMP domain-containing histidine kinase [bacterium]|nr:HAMP domain-containing histidine kinase [bacterium]